MNMMTLPMSTARRWMIWEPYRTDQLSGTPDPPRLCDVSENIEQTRGSGEYSAHLIATRYRMPDLMKYPPTSLM